MKAEIRIRDLSGPAISDWMKNKSNSQMAMGLKIFHAHKNLVSLADDNASNDSIKRICRIVLDYIEDIPDKFFRETFFGTTRTTLKAKMRLIKINCAKLVALLEENGRDVEDSQRLLTSIFNKMHFVAETVLECAHARPEEG